MNRVLGAMLVLLLLGALLVLVAFDSNGLVLALSLAVLLLGVAVVRWNSRKRAPVKERNGFLRLTLFGSQALGCFFLFLMGAALAAIAIPNFIRFQAGGGKHSFATRIREAFHLTRRMEVNFNDGLNDQIREEVQIVPVADWSLQDVNLLYAKEQAKTRVVSRSPFQEGKIENEPRLGMDVVIQNDDPLVLERTGLLSSRITLDPHEIALDVVNLAEKPPRGRPRSSQMTWVASRVANEKWTLRITLPKNAFLASFPAADLQQHPDRDVLSVKIEKVEQPVELYVLPIARFEPVQRFAQATLGSYLPVELAKWLFAPVLLALVALFRETLTESLVGGAKKLLLQKKPKPSIGFKPGGEQ